MARELYLVLIPRAITDEERQALERIGAQFPGTVEPGEAVRGRPNPAGPFETAATGVRLPADSQDDALRQVAGALGIDPADLR
jgi:hypothetical protein